MPRFVTLCLGIAAAALGFGSRQEPHATRMTPIAERYVKTVLALGRHDADYVDAYYGPQIWKDEAQAKVVDLETLALQATSVRADLQAIPAGADEMTRLRWQHLDRQLSALEARIRMLRGDRLSFDEESKALYDAVAPTYPTSRFQAVLDVLEKRFPGQGSLAVRYDQWRKPFGIPPERLDRVVGTAIEACRQRTARHVMLPKGETFTVETVTGKSWSGYNWYQGNFRSLIQVNTDLPIYIDRAIDLACHEGYPGHHVYNALREKTLVRDRGWVEFTVYPLFSPQSLIAEGTANFGIEVAFPGPERVEYEKAELFPLAGIDPSRAAEYFEVQALVDQLSYAGNDAARQYIDGRITAAQAAEFLERYAMYAPERARQRVRFIDQYRSYVINYNLGKDMVRQFIEGRGGTAANPAERWTEFETLLSSPRLPSGLK
jgi:hypothetical protein